MKFGVNTFIWSDRFGREQVPLLERVHSAGFDGIEVPLFDSHDYDDEQIRAALRSSGLERTVCSVLPPGLTVFDESATARIRTADHLRGCIEAAANIGAHLIAGPLYSPVGYLPGRRRTDDEWRRAIDFYREIAPSLEAADVTLAIEPLNRYETFFLNTAADAAHLCAEVAHPRVGILFDTYHANIEEKNIADAIRICGKHIKHFHSCENDRGIPGTGHVDWPAVLIALKETGYDQYLTIESFGFSIGALSAAASIWRDLAPAAEDIAFEGLRFLKAQTRA